MSEKYNGWTNYETWNVKLWLDNEEGSCRYWEERAQEVYNDSEAERSLTRKERSALTLKDELKEQIEEANPIGGDASMFADLLNAALSEVNWYEIAESYLSEIEDEEETEEEEAS